jgi:peptidoglycan/xylan/chitin deacetylase (PgdA/CDA1 family)
MSINQFYYYLKPLIPRSIQLNLRRRFVIKRKRLQYADTWPIDEFSKKSQDPFSTWPNNKKFALVLTHDVDTKRGQEKCPGLMHKEKGLGFRSSFNFVPERYRVDPGLRRQLDEAGFEVGVHGLNHDGKLYKSRQTFQERAPRINRYLKEWGAVGFRSPSMHHNLEWIHELNIEYDASTFDTDPFEPQSDGVGTIFPFWVSKDDTEDGYVELPYTLPQDFTLFILMKEKNIDIWKEKLDWVAEHGGMVLVNTHPDYMNFSCGKLGIEEYPADYYKELLEYIRDRYEGQYLHVLPREIARFWVDEVLKKICQ